MTAAALLFAVTGCNGGAQSAPASKKSGDGSASGKGQQVPQATEAGATTSAASTATPPPPPTMPSTVEAPPADPFARGFCEYTIAGGEVNKGGGGIMNVMTKHWMAADAPGRSMSGNLLINCGATPQITLQQHNFDEALAMAPGKYVVDKTGAVGTMSIIAAFPLAEAGELEITVWDTARLAGTFKFSITQDGETKPVAGSFDLRCPYPASASCVP